MPWDVYDFTDEAGASVIGEWIRSLASADRAKFKEKVGLLKRCDAEFPPKLLAGPIYRSIYKLRINTATRALRPMLCKGPFDIEREFTLLFGAVEIGDVLVPQDAPQIADANRSILLGNPDRRQRR